MKKIVKFALSLFLVFGFALTGCNNSRNQNAEDSSMNQHDNESSTDNGGSESTHEHTFASSWDYDDAYHWHPSTCGHDVVSDKERHNFKSKVTDPTYEEGGYTTYTCLACGYSYIDDKTNKLEHNYSSTWSFDEDSHWHACTDKGYEYLKKDESSHNFTSVVTDPTYEQGGYTTYTCTTCGYSYVDNKIDSLPISIIWKNYDGTVLEVDENVSYGSMPSYDGEIPIREDDSQYTYIFDSRSPEISVAVESCVYIATFKREERVILLDGIELNNPYTTFRAVIGEKGTILLPHKRDDLFFAYPQNFTESIYDVQFFSSDSSVYNVNPTTGEYEALKEGSCIISRHYISSYNTISVSAVVNVYPPIQNIAFRNSSKNITIFDDDIEDLYVETSPGYWEWINSKDEISFESSNPKIVSIFSQDKSGSCKVQAHNIPGTVTITAKSKILGITCSTTVTVKVANIKFLNDSNFSMSKTVMIQDEKYQLKTNMEASFVSLNTDILKVDSNGEVTALKSGHGQIKAISKINNTEAILDIYVYNFNFDYPIDEFNLSNYYLINGHYVGDAYATCKIQINAIHTAISLDYSGNRCIEVLMDVSAEKISGLDGEFKINSFIYNENGARLDKTTFNLGYISVGQKIEKELQLMGIYSNSETIDSVFDKTLQLEFDGVAW